MKPSREMKIAACTLARRGFTLVELMISLTIGLMLLAGLFTVFENSSRAYAELKKSSEHAENGRMAIWELSRDVSLAGYYGEFYALPAPGAAPPDPCVITPAALYAALAFPVQGYEAPAMSPLSCLSNGDFVAGTDILVVRRADTTALLPTDVPTDNEIYIQTTSSAAEIQVGDAVSAIGTTKKADSTNSSLFQKDGITAAPIRKFHVHIYFIAPCSVPSNGGNFCTGAGDDGGRPMPTLKRLELASVAGATTLRVAPLVEGIENLQIDYGIDSSPATQDASTGQFGDGSPDSYTSSPAAADWSNVVSMKVRVLARASQLTLGHTDIKTYDMGLAGTVGPFNDWFKRHLFSEAIRLVNVSGRREIPQ